MNEVCAMTLLGGLEVQQGERRITRFRTYKTGALLAYLAFYPNIPHSREVLTDLFWPDSEAGRLSLRVAAGSLRRQLESPDAEAGEILVATRANLYLNPAAVQVDVTEFEEALRAAASAPPPERIEWLMRAVERYRGPLLPGYYEDWILPERGRLAEAYVGALHQLCTLLEETEDPFGALEYGHRAVIAAPFGEEAHVALMGLYMRAGRQADALHHYAQLERTLISEWGDSSAMPAAAALAADLQRGFEADRAASPRTAIAFSTAQETSSPPASGPLLSPARRLPLPFTRLFGREAEIASLRRLCLPDLSTIPAGFSPRLITITGQGGIGKTRLAVEVGGRCSETPQRQVWFVPLADLADPRLMPDAVAAALGIGRAAMADPLEQVAQALSAGPSLLILDNMEHLLVENPAPETAAMEGRTAVLRLLEAAPDLTILVTSRQSLEIEGETVFPLSPLAVPAFDAHSGTSSGTGSMPADGAADRIASLAASPSVQMFVDRAQKVRPDFQLTPRNADAVAALCARLEGVPLFIELAAAWAQTYTPAQMLSEIAPGRLLASRRKDRPQRQRSAHAVVDWSFQLLPPSLQRFFAHLSIFAGGWTLAAAEEICAAPEAVEALGELHARSMIVAEAEGDTMRYRLPEALRQCAAERLSAAEQERLAARHSAFFLRFAEQADRESITSEQQGRLERLAVEQDNLRAALAWSRSGETGVRLAAALCPFWEARGEATEGRRRLLAALAGATESLTLPQARALAGLTRLATLQGDYAEARKAGEASWQALRLLQEDRAAVAVGTLLSRAYHTLGEVEKAKKLLTECLALCRQFGGSVEMAAALLEQGRRHGYYSEYDAADRRLHESRTLFLQLGDQHGIARVAIEQAIIQQYRQNLPAANAFYEQALTLFQALGDRVRASDALHGIGYVARLSGDLSLASATLEKFLTQQRQMVLKGGMLLGLRNLGCVARDQGDLQRAITLFEEALTLARINGERQMEAETLGSMAVVCFYNEDYRQARALHEQCLQFRRENGYRQDIAESLGHLAFLDLVEGSLPQARSRLTESLRLSREVGIPIGIASQLTGLSLVALQQGEIAEAIGACRESLQLLKTTRGLRETIAALEQMARLCHALGSYSASATLLAASDTLRLQYGFRGFPPHQAFHDSLAAALQRALQPEALHTASTNGAAMTLEAAVDYALGRNGIKE